jgi:ribonuclease R
LSGGRVDLRQIPLVTIDGIDARDFDDAVFAEPDTDPKNPGGWHLIVAIADVSYYVRPNSALDQTAYERGNSTYFADRVVPMLPERLSNDLCSLRPQVNRACLAAHLWIDAHARLKSWQFVRGLMRSAARLTYEQVEDAHLGNPDDTTGPLTDAVIKPLYRAYSLLKHAREERGALELDLPERKALINAEGQITDIVPRKRLASHQLIEEFMILANVAAAQALEAKRAPCVYRIHDSPAYDRLESTREFLKELGYSLPKSDQLRPKNINHILKISADREDKQLIHTILLRTQSQAVYSPNNIGHFGLALEKYAHFTSPIRRYADLLVHRSLTRAFGFGEGALTDQETQGLVGICEHISQTERRSMLAERDVMDRFTAQYLSANVGREFKGHIGSVTRFGLFVTLDDTGADGIVPMRTLPRDYYIHDEKRHALIGKDYGRTYRLADPVVVRLVEADAMRGSTVFELLDGFTGKDTPDFLQPQRREHKQGRRNDKDRRRGKFNKGDRNRKRRRR